MSKKGRAKVERHLKELEKMVNDAKAKDALYDLNEYLRLIVMGPYGDTEHDRKYIEKLHLENSSWKKKPYTKKSQKRG